MNFIAQQQPGLSNSNIYVGGNIYVNVNNNYINDPNRFFSNLDPNAANFFRNCMQNQNPTNFNNNVYASGNNNFYNMPNFNQPFFKESSFSPYNCTSQSYQFQSFEQQNSNYSANCKQYMENQQFQQAQRQQCNEQYQRQCFDETNTYQSHFNQSNLNQNMVNNQIHNNCDSLRNTQSRLNDNISHTTYDKFDDSNNFSLHQNNEFNSNIQTSNSSTTQERRPQNNVGQVQFNPVFDFTAVETQVSNHIESLQDQDCDIYTDDNLNVSIPHNFADDEEPVHHIVDV